jgi:hypothetical protein
MNLVLKGAIEALSHVVNVPRGLTHPLDDSRAKELLMALKSKGIPLIGEDVYALAVENAWPERHARSFADLAEQIARGSRVDISHPKDWGEAMVLRIISEASNA